MAIEVSLKEQGQLHKRLMRLDGITSASIASHGGEVTV